MTTVEQVWEWSRGFQVSRILLSGVELGIFAQLGDRRRTSAEVAAAIGADARATDRLMNALVALDMLGKEGDLFHIPTSLRDALVPGGPAYMGSALMYANHLWDNWSTLTEAVIAGTSVVQLGEGGFSSIAGSFIAAMNTLSSQNAPKIVLHIDLAGVKRLLDVGGGSGAYSIAFCNTQPDLSAVIFDQPEVVPITRDYIEKSGMAGRITTAVGDFNTDPLPPGFDVAFLSQVLHSNSRPECRQLIRKVFDSLNPGGQVAIQEFVVDENRTSPSNAAIFALNMLVGTSEGDTFTESEINEWLRDAGFTDIRRADPPTNTALITARKRT